MRVEGQYRYEGELDKLFLTLEFENDDDTVKIVVFYFFELAMIGRERKQQINVAMLDLIDD